VSGHPHHAGDRPAAPLAGGPDEHGVHGEIQHDRYVGDQPLTRWDSPPGRTIARAAEVAGRRVGARTTLLVTLGIGVVIAFLLSFLVARVYDGVTQRDGISALDVPVLHTAKGLRSPALDWFAAAVAYVFGPVGMPLMAVAAMLLLALRRRSWTPVILIAAAGLGSLLMTIAGKDIIGRHRPVFADAIPPFEYSPSFPSGHTLNATVIAGIIAYLLVLRQHSALARGITIAAALVLAITVGITRIVLAAHWFTDVLAAWLLGLAWLAIVITAHRLYLTARERGAPPTGRRPKPVA
jgi:membrane-associated phospholipid phosphatase